MDAARAALLVDGVKNVTVLYRRLEEDMPADKDEIKEAKEAGVKFVFLGAPKEHKNGLLTYMEMRTCGRDAKGRNNTCGTDVSVYSPESPSLERTATVLPSTLVAVIPVP